MLLTQLGCLSQIDRARALTVRRGLEPATMWDVDLAYLLILPYGLVSITIIMDSYARVKDKI